MDVLRLTSHMGEFVSNVPANIVYSRALFVQARPARKHSQFPQYSPPTQKKMMIYSKHAQMYQCPQHYHPFSKCRSALIRQNVEAFGRNVIELPSHPSVDAPRMTFVGPLRVTTRGGRVHTLCSRVCVVDLAQEAGPGSEPYQCPVENIKNVGPPGARCDSKEYSTAVSL